MKIKISFPSLIRGYVDEHGIKSLVEEAQVTERTARRWLAGQSKPSLHPQRLHLSRLIGCPYNVLVSLIEEKDTINVYVACGLHKLGTARNMMRSLENIGCNITYDWTEHGAMNAHGTTMLKEIAEKEYHGVLDCDILVLCYPHGRRGSHFEMGVAYHSKKDIVIVSEGEIDKSEIPSFYCMDNVSFYEGFTPSQASYVIFGRYGNSDIQQNDDQLSNKEVQHAK